MKKNIVRSLAVIIAVTSGYVAWAHPGHGNTGMDGNSVLHFISEPVHLLFFGVIVVLFMVARYFYLRTKSRSR